MFGSLVRLVERRKTIKVNMDDATIQFLIKKRIQVEDKKIPLDPNYKEKVLKLTKQMMEEPFTGSIKTAFDTYISECMTHLTRIEEPVREDPPQNIHDSLLYPSKKVTTMVKKKSIFHK
jgi:hypothetical protein